MINAKTTGSQSRGYSRLHFVCDASDKFGWRACIAQALISKRADVYAKDAKGNTPLLLATGVGIIDVQKLLIDSRADVAAVNFKDNCAL